MPTITIESILGGQGITTHFGQSGQMRASLGIDPSQPIDDSDTAYSTIASGLIRPSSSQKFSGATITSAPLWLVPNPKDALVYILDANGSAYTINAAFDTVTALNDRGFLSSCLANGCEYYDNYIYFFKNTDVTRYGPLNGTASFALDANNSYWVTTLGKTALVNTAYPKTFKNNLQLPNHVACRHSDGRLYFTDVVGNLGTIHYIQTSKTTVEGDTNNGSTYSAVTMGYGLWPTDIETYGTEIAIATIEVSGNLKRDMRAKLAFWDTVATNINSQSWIEYPDSIISALKNIDGVLYIASGNINARGFRICKFIGGQSFEEVFVSETGEPPLPGAIDGILHKILIGNHTNVPESDGCLYSIGAGKVSPRDVFNVMRATGGTSSTNVTAVLLADNNEMGFDTPIIGWTQAGDGSAGVSHGLDKQGTQYNNAPSVYWSQMFRIGQPFKITSIRIPLAQAVAANMTIVPKIYTDDGAGTTYTLTTIDNTNYPSKFNIKQKLENATGEHNFWLELKWTGSVLATVGLPITIEYELLND